MDTRGTIRSIFGTRRALIGVIQGGALPAAPRSRETVDALPAAAADDARAYREAGFSGLMVENMHDRPYLRREVGPEVVAAMTVVASAVRREAPDLSVGIQVLAGANRESMAVAHASGARFVRVEGFVFAHVADEGLMQSDAGTLLRYRRQIGAEAVAVFADAKKKHPAPALTAHMAIPGTGRRGGGAGGGEPLRAGGPRPPRGAPPAAMVGAWIAWTPKSCDSPSRLTAHTHGGAIAVPAAIMVTASATTIHTASRRVAPS